MEFKALFPTLFDRKPRSHSTRKDLAQIANLNYLRAEFSIVSWLLVGATLQSLLVLLPALLPKSLSFPVAYALVPTVALLAYRAVNLALEVLELKQSPQREGVVPGKHAAMVPGPKGGFVRTPGQSVGGGGMVVFLLGARSNSPLGIFSPSYIQLGNHFLAMYKDLESNPTEYSFLGGSTYSNVSDRLTSPEMLFVMYFKDVEGLHKFAKGKVHQEGWDWFVKEEAKMDKLEKGGKTVKGGIRDVGISHEAYVVPDGGFENIYHNYAPSNFAATTHLIETEGGVKAWACPIVDANRNRYLKASASRLGTIQG